MFLQKNICATVNWCQHVGSWFGAMEGIHAFKAVQYETILTDPLEQFKSMASFLQLDTSQNLIENCIKKYQFEKLQKMESSQKSVAPTTKNKKEGYNFFRKGKAGGWRDFEYADCFEPMTSRWFKTMKMLGYDPSLNS